MTEQIHDPNAELSVIAACVESAIARAEAKRHITGGDFYEPRFEVMWDAMTRLERTGRPVDIATLSATLAGDTTPAGRYASQTVPDLFGFPAVPDNVGAYAEIVRGFAIRRRVVDEATRARQAALDLSRNASGMAAEVANRFAAVRDTGVTDDVSAKTLAEILAEPDDEPDWLVPGLLERQDRFVLTGDEGLGKSHLLRQIALSAAAGVDPWDTARRFDPIRALIFDCENNEGQVRRAARGMADFAARYGDAGVADRVNIRCSARVDITRDKDLALIHRELDAQQPDIVVIGPLYRLSPRAIQNDDDAAPLLAALDTIRDRGIALLIEAHSGHAIGKGGSRDMRPRGSSALLGWPEFGYGLRDLGSAGKRYCEFVAWRGNRSERAFPRALRRAEDGVRWVPYDGPMTGAEQWAS